MNLHVSLKRAAACIAAILPIALVALALSVHGAFVLQHPHRAPGLHIDAGPSSTHHAAPGRQGHLIGWIDHLVGPFTSIAATL